MTKDIFLLEDVDSEPIPDKPEKMSYISYTVKAGDTLWRIAQRY